MRNCGKNGIFKMEKNMKRFVILLLLASCSCSYPQIKDAVMGMTPDYVERFEKKYTKTFDLEASTCFNEALGVLKEMKAHMRRMNRKEYFIVAVDLDKAYEFCIDTTEVGMLINPLGPGRSEVIVASGNYDLARFVSERLFERLGKRKK